MTHYEQECQQPGAKGSLRPVSAPGDSMIPGSSAVEPITRPLVGMSDLPDELLDDIASFASPNTLRSLALVEQRWYAPARKQTVFEVLGMEGLLGFADALLERPKFVHVVRHARFHEAGPTKTCTDLTYRAMGVIVQECARLKSLSTGPLPPSVAAQCQLMAAVGNLRHLSNVRITNYHGDLYFDAFAKVAPALQRLDTLHVALNLARHKATLRLPPCGITKLDLMLSHCTLEDFELIVGGLTTQTLHLNLVVANKGDGITDWSQPPYHTRFNTLLQPIVTRTQFFTLLVITNSRQADSHRLLDWPTRSGGVCLFVENTGSIYARFETCWWVGTPDACLRHVHVKLQALRDGGGGRKLMRVWARRGEGWTVVHAAILEAVCGEDIKLVWE